MTEEELRYWLSVTEASRIQWVEDTITRLNGNGALFYRGGENGVYIRVQPDGKLSAGTYEGAYPHIGEAIFRPKTVVDCGGFDAAIQKAGELRGSQFIRDLLSEEAPQRHQKCPAQPDMEIKMM